MYFTDKIQNLVERLGTEQGVALTGDDAKNVGLVRSIGKALGTPTSVPEEPRIVAALGASLVAEEKAFPITVSKQPRN